jgi:hypothetical protein
MPPTRERLNDLAQSISADTYRVSAESVAGAIIAAAARGPRAHRG